MNRKTIGAVMAVLLALFVLPFGSLAADETAEERADTSASWRAVSVDARSVPQNSVVWDFESDPMTQGFSVVDADGDGQNWTWISNATSYQYHYEGNGCMKSDSYASGVDLTPDNWLVTPAFAGGVSLSFWYNPLSSSYPNEHVSVYVSEDGGETWSDSLCDVTIASSVEPVEYTVDLSDYEDKDIVAGFRHFDSSGQYSAVIDYITVILPDLPDPTPEPTGEPTPEPTSEPTPEPTAEPKLIYSCGFENSTEVSRWTKIDADGDGDNWQWYCSPNYTTYAYEGDGLMTSASLSNEGPIMPDNWLISPAVELGEGAPFVAFYAAYRTLEGDKFAVYAGTDLDSLQPIGGVVTATKEYVRYEYDLSPFAGQTVMIAIRHFDTESGLILRVDNFEVWDAPVPDGLWGDADGDGELTPDDALRVMRYSMHAEEIDRVLLPLCNVNALDGVDMEDALLIIRKAQRIEACFPVEEQDSN